MRIAVIAILALGCGARTLGDCDYCAAVGDDASLPRVDGGVIGRDVGVDPDVAVPPPDSFVDVGPTPTSCPKTLPKDDGPCAVSEVCSYAGCDSKKPDIATCVSGRWSVVAQACTTTPDRCPVTMPLDRSSCALPAGMFCSWNEECVASSRGSCVGGRWEIKHGGCGDSHLCPPTLPAKGTTCPKTAPGTGFGCSYRNACGVPAFAFCSESTWGIEGYDDPPCSPTPDCPTALPAPTTGCEGKRTCVYPNDCGSVDYASCYGGPSAVWNVSKLPCPDFRCPPTPEEGTKCSVSGQTCTYPAGRGCSIACTCSGGEWDCAKPPCGAGMGGGGK